jgi:hypothetical protein
MPRLLEANIKLRPVGIGETGPLGLYVGGGIACPGGSPTVLLETSEAFAYYGAEPKTYVGVMNINVQSMEPECFTYFTWEMKLWGGIPTESCPTSVCLSLWGNFNKQALKDELLTDGGYEYEIPW